MSLDKATEKASKPKLTNKQKAFVQELLTNPKATKTSAYLKAYDVKPGTKLNSIHKQAVDTYSNPKVISVLSGYNDIVEESLINVVKDWGREENTRKREIALNNAQYIHDKVHGKATQQIETKQSVVSISIDLTQDDTTGSDLT